MSLLSTSTNAINMSTETNEDQSDRKQSNVGLVWFKNTDLRIHDHAPLLKAHHSCDEVIHLMVVDPFWFTDKTRLLDIQKSGIFRANFMRQSIADLRSSLQSIGSDLIVRFGNSADIIPSIVEQYAVDSVYFHDEIHSEEKSVVSQVISACQDKVSHPVRFESSWGANTLCNVEDLPWDTISDIPETFSQFLKKFTLENYEKFLENFGVLANVPCRAPLDTLTRELCQLHPEFEDIGSIPSLAQFGCSNGSTSDHIEIDARSQFPFQGGESAALARLKHVVWGEDGTGGRVTVYNETRDQSIGTEYSTKFSPFLAHGNLSSRTILKEIQNFEAETGIVNKSTYWVYWELMCRDFFRFSSVKYGDRIFYENGPWGKSRYVLFQAADWEWKRDPVLFQKWCDGETGYPLIDAAMIELKTTGFMSNRMRQNTANFLVKDMGIDWRWGAEWFESLLLDYDVSQNYCNWNYVAHLAFNVCNNRYFNIMKQAQEYDTEGKFVKLWIPELSACPTANIHLPSAMSEDALREHGVVYPAPCCVCNPPPSKKKKFQAQAGGSGKKKQRKSKKERRRLRELRELAAREEQESKVAECSDSSQISV